MSAIADGIPPFLLCGGLIFLLHWLMFVPAYLFQTERYFDLTGSLSYIGAVALALFVLMERGAAVEPRSQVIALLIAVWAARLGGFLFIRVLRRGGDGRFDAIKPRFFRFLFTWNLSAVWVLVTVSAGLAAVVNPYPYPLVTAWGGMADWLFYGGLALWTAGFGLEVTADSQKSRFNRQSANKGRFIQSGLWSRSRHPNYLGEIMLWCGIALMAAPALHGWWYLTLASPFFVGFLLIKVSGVRLLQQRAEAKWGDDPAYRRYKAQTPMLLPRLRRG